VETIVGLLTGYLLWLLLSNLVTPEIIGKSSVVISFSGIFMTIANIGIPLGISHLLGKNRIENNLEYSMIYVKTSIIITILGIIAVTLTILISKEIIYFFDIYLIVLSVLIIASSCMASLFRYIVIATLDTKKLPLVILASSGAKSVIAIGLVFIGEGVIGIIIGHLSYHLVSCFLLAYYVKGIVQSYPKKHVSEYRSAFKRILSASVPSWVPTLITGIGGGDLGLIIIFALTGASQAGSYFLAYSIYSALAAISYSLFTIALPWLSGMDDRRKRLTSELIKLSLILSVPISSSIILYSYDVMLSFGIGYTNASTSLGILLSTLLPFSFFIGITTLVYSYGNYRQVLLLGLVSTLPRVFLYITLTGSYGATGVAVSFAVGTIAGFILAIHLAKKMSFRISARELSAIMLIPLGVSFVFVYFNINYVLAILATTMMSYILFMKLQILKRDEVEDTLNLLPLSIRKPLTKMIDGLWRKLGPKY
jgi:O-antigen/teichoic acid export membrane protein